MGQNHGQPGRERLANGARASLGHNQFCSVHEFVHILHKAIDLRGNLPRHCGQLVAQSAIAPRDDEQLNAGRVLRNPARNGKEAASALTTAQEQDGRTRRVQPQLLSQRALFERGVGKFDAHGLAIDGDFRCRHTQTDGLRPCPHCGDKTAVNLGVNPNWVKGNGVGDHCGKGRREPRMAQAAPPNVVEQGVERDHHVRLHRTIVRNKPTLNWRLYSRKQMAAQGRQSERAPQQPPQRQTRTDHPAVRLWHFANGLRRLVLPDILNMRFIAIRV